MPLKYPHLMSPLKIRGKVLKNRLAASNSLPHFLQGPEPFPADSVIAHYENKAKSAAIVTCMGINNFSRGKQMPMSMDFGHFPDFDLYDTGCQNYLMQLADSIHYYDSLACMAIFVGPPSAYPIMRFKSGGSSDGKNSQEVPEQTSDMVPPPPMEYDLEKIPAHEDPSYYTDEQLEDIASSYAEQAGILQMLGFDMVSIHMCYNANLPAKMFSKKLNRRTDKWGGNLENRMRLPLLVLEKVREKVGPKMILEIEWSAEEENGYDLEESAAFLNQAKKYIDIVQLRYYEIDHAHPTSFNLEHTPFLHYGEYMKKHVPGLTIAVIGGFQYPEDGENAIAEGKADLIYAARAFISNPDYGQLVLEGRDDDIVPCLRCNKCHGRGEHDPFVSVCSVNPLIGLEQKADRMKIPTKGGKKVAIIGGGPAAMRCAMDLQDRGHIPTIYEKNSQLGGATVHSDYADFKWCLRDFKNYLIHQMDKRKITVHLNTAATPEMIKSQNYDVVIAAVGASPVLLSIPGADPDKISFYHEVFAHPENLGEKVVIIGGGEVGCEMGIYLARLGHQATVLEMREKLSADSTLIHYYSMLQETWENEPNFHGITSAKVSEIEKNMVKYMDESNHLCSIPFDSIVMAAGMRANQDEALSFFGCAKEFYMIGDCKQPATIQQAMRSAYSTAMRI